ncbi:MAG: hypothetical protein AAF502_22540 [Bacteroidota bacterium]
MIKRHKRKSLYKLLLLFERKTIKRSPDEDHAIIFEKVFGGKYQSSKDYLLRNEYRLLRQLLEDFLVESELLKYAEENTAFKDLHLLKALARRNKHELAASLAESKIKAAENAYHYDLAAEMSSVLFRLHAFYRAPNSDDMTAAVKALQQKKQFLDLHHLHAYRLIRTQVGFSQRSLSHSIDFTDHFPYEGNYDQEEIDTPLSKFYDLKFKIYMLPHGAEKIHLLKEAYLLMELFGDKNPGLQSEREFCILTLALEHFLIGDYVAAEKLYEEYFSVFKTKSHNHLSALYNYASNQIKLEKYEQVLEIINENENLFTGNDRFALFFNILRTSSCLRLGQADTLRTYMPVNFSGLPRNFNYYYRLVYCALFYLENNLEIAVQEARNFAKVVKGDDEFLPYFQMANGFISFFKWNDKLQGKRALLDIQKTITHYSDEMIPEYRDFMPFLWLKAEIEKKIKE